jgi:hypothetical protein
MSAEDLRRVLAAMRSGEWLRTQWIARTAFELGTAPWQASYARRVLVALGRLETDGLVERRDTSEAREGEIAGQLVRFAIPRSEWHLTTIGGD